MSDDSIRFDEHTCRNLEVSSRREWLETNGLGGYASSTIAGLNTRRYHGLLVAATRPPVGRMVLLSKVEETLVVGARRFDLSANQYPGVVHPQGYLYLKEFRLDPFPVFTYECEGILLEKSVFAIHGENSTAIRYELHFPGGQGFENCVLEVRPLIAFRDYHSTTHENGALNAAFDNEPWSVRVEPYGGLPALYLNHTGAQVQGAGYWYRDFEYAAERERGLDYREDLFSPFALVFRVDGDCNVGLIAATERRDAGLLEELRAGEIERRAGLLQGIPTEDEFQQSLVRAADQFIVARGPQSTVIAGYHWFSDWGRDTMIALPGLALSAGRPEIARSILEAFAAHVDRGMLPNRFPDAGDVPEYNTVDGTLWFFEAVRAFAADAEDSEFVRRLYGVLAEIISWHERGTRYGIRVDDDGLLLAGGPGTQLTWMDAKIGDWVVTPRHGKPVEIQALWYNALRIMEDLAVKFQQPTLAEHYREMADRARQRFRTLFWNEAAGCLYDTIQDERRNSEIRPNQILAVSLFHRMLPPAQEYSVVEVVEQHLLTPFGLRSLSPDDPHYRGRYGGEPVSRDSAYHQGTVWPWLMGPFLSAYLRVNAGSEKARKQARQWLVAFRSFIQDEGMGGIPEVFDGDAPHRPGGCITQAWSVAEVLRVHLECAGDAVSLDCSHAVA